MESVTVKGRKVVKVSDLLSAQTASCQIPPGADSIILMASSNGQYIEIDFIATHGQPERVLRNVKSKE